MTDLRIAFMGTPAWSVPIVDKLHQNYAVTAVYTQPPRPQNRGHQVHLSPVHNWAVEHGVHVEHPTTLRNIEAKNTFREHAFDWVVVAAYGLILPKYALSCPFGATNVHASLLPRWRGAAPLHRALLAGDKETGITIMDMDEGLDTGDVWLMESYTINPNQTITQLHDDMSQLGADLLVKTTPLILSGEHKPTPQPTEGITYAHKIVKEEGLLNFELNTANDLERRVRALAGWPGTYFEYDGTTYKVHAAHVSSLSLQAGSHHLSKTFWEVGCAGGTTLSLDILQKPGGRPLPIADFLHGMEKKG